MGLRACLAVRRFEQIAEWLPVIVWTTDRSGEINYINAHWRKLTGIRLSHERSRQIGACINAIHPEDRELFDVTRRNAIEKGAAYAIEIRVWSAADFGWRWHFVQAAPVRVRDDGSPILGWVGTGADIEEMKRAHAVREDLLHHTENEVKMREQFISIASHELKTPITTILLQIQLLERDLRRSGRFRELRYVEFSLRELGRLNVLINDLLDFTRMRGGRFQLQKKKVQLSRLVEECVDRLAAEAAQSGVEIRSRLEPGIEGIWDATRLEQVLTNLITNALKYGKRRPIDVSLQREGEEGVALAVRDHGDGIAPEMQSRLFHPFQRAAIAEKVASGLGLGLFIVSQIVEAHQGRISLRSVPGDGAAFTVHLPGALAARRAA